MSSVIQKYQRQMLPSKDMPLDFCSTFHYIMYTIISWTSRIMNPCFHWLSYSDMNRLTEHASDTIGYNLRQSTLDSMWILMFGTCVIPSSLVKLTESRSIPTLPHCDAVRAETIEVIGDLIMMSTLSRAFLIVEVSTQFIHNERLPS